MTPKRQVMMLVIIFSTLGIGVSVAIIATGGGFTGEGPSITNPPSEEDLWTIGENINQGLILNYELTATTPTSSLNSADVSIYFAEETEDEWLVQFTVTNGTGAEEQSSVRFSKQLTREGPIDEAFAPYYDPIHSSIFSIRDIAIGSKYLVVGAPWDIIFTGSSSTQVKITGKEMIQTPAGEFDSFVLAYTIDDLTSSMWLVKDMPLPVKALVYGEDGGVMYSYELTSVENKTA